MNFWQWMLFYFYSGAALIGLCGTSSNLSAHRDMLPTRERCADGTDRIISDEEREERAKRARMVARDAVVRAAQEIGDQMASATSGSIVAGYNTHILNVYEKSKAQQQALADAQAINPKGA